MVSAFFTARKTAPARHRSRAGACVCVLSLVLSGAMPLIAAADETAAQDEGQAGQPKTGSDKREITVSGSEALQVAGALVERGALEEAEAILDPLLASATDRVDQTQVQFLKGMIAASRGEYAAAETIFRHILRDRPDLVRIRLELARVLYEQEKDVAAAYHFRLALGEPDLPDETKANVRRYLSVIEDRRIWKVGVSFALQPSTNINAAPDDPTISQYGIPGLTLREEDTSQQGIGAASAVTVSVFPRINSRLRLEARGGLRYTDHEKTRHDDAFAWVEAGPRIRAGRYTVSALAGVTRRYYGGEPYSTSRGLRLILATPLAERTRFILRAGLHDTEYDKATMRDGASWSLGGSLMHILDRRTRADLGLTVTREDAELGPLKNTQYHAEAGLAREFAHGISVGVRPAYIYREFDEPDPNLGAGFGLGEEGDLPVREDRIWSLNIQMTKRDWNFRGFAPVFGYTYLTSNSTNDLYNYDRHSAEIALTREF